MDSTIPADVEIRARLLQVREFYVGTKKKPTSGSYVGNQAISLKIVISWIEVFGIIHMAWSVEGGSNLELDTLQAKLPEKRIDFSDSVSNAGLLATEWVYEVALAFDDHIKAMDPCPVEIAKGWTDGCAVFATYNKRVA
jgi:hypothetical protein